MLSFSCFWPFGAWVKDIVIGAGGVEFNSQAGQIGTQCRHRRATAAAFRRSSVAQTLSLREMVLSLASA